ncbi:TonB-dependent siderophore receptor [Pseudomonas sp. CGJS7]|uniref:TonB-dependent siderophore receptor n=1 Tax=Pseudomonas sp. CGJS7 TaxID=3109348 RepID=UPI003008C38B
MLLSLGATSAQAEDAADADQVKNLQQVQVTAESLDSYAAPATVSATRMVLTQRETPQSVTVITRQQIEDFGYVTIADVLQNTTGIFVNNLSSLERPSFMARGLDVNNIQVDGVQQFPGGRRPDVGGDSVAYERVELVRGANGLMTGTGEPSATVNMIRKRATRRHEAYVNASVGRWNNYRIEGDVSGPLLADGRVRGRVAAAYTDRESFIDYYSTEKKTLYGTLEADLSDNTLLRIGLETTSTDQGGVINTNNVSYWYSDGSRINPPRSFSTAAKSSAWPLEERTYFAGLDHSFANGWHLSAIATHNTIDMQGGQLYFMMPWDYPDRDGGGPYTDSAVISWSADKQNTFDAFAEGPFRLFGREHQLVFGYNSFSRTRTTLGTDFDPATRPLRGEEVVLDAYNLWTWRGQAPRYTAYRTGHRDNAVHTDQGGGYLAVRLNLADPLKLLLGARVSNWKTWTRNFDRATGAFSGISDGYRVDDEITPYAGLVYDLNSTYSLYASYADVFLPQEQYDRNDRMIEPMIGKNYEIGAKAEYLDGRLNASFAYFESVQDNLAIADPNVPPNYLTPGGRSPYVSSGKGNRTKGAEFEFSGQLAPDWNLYGGFTHAITRNGAGQRINTYIPKNLLRLSTTYRLPGAWRRLTVGGGLQWQSAYHTVAGYPLSPERSAQAPYELLHVGTHVRRQSAVGLVNAMARYEINDRLSLSLNVNNLFDKYYYNSISEYDGSVGWGEPRNWVASARYRW